MAVDNIQSGPRSRRRIGWSRFVVPAALLSAVVLAPSKVSAEAVSEREQAVKAAFLFHFTQFVEWPAEATPPAGSPIRIGILHADPIGRVLMEIVRDEKVNDRPIEVVQLDRVEDATDCQILFIPRRARESQREAIGRLGHLPILLVSENPAFVREGGAISLVRKAERVEILINRDSLKEAGLTANARLLRLAEIVGRRS